jgi:hypothetical protein
MENQTQEFLVVGPGGLEPPTKRLWAVSSEIEQQARGDFLAARKALEWRNCVRSLCKWPIEFQDNLNMLAVEARSFERFGQYIPRTGVPVANLIRLA